MNKIEARRQAAGLSIAELSRQSGVPYRTVQDWCSGARPATNAYRIRAAARVMGCHIEDLLEDEEPKT